MRKFSTLLFMVVLFCIAKSNAQVISATTYPLTPATGISLASYSSLATLVSTGKDDDNSVITNIGFDFWFDGIRYTQFGANANGFLTLGAVPTGTNALYTNNLANGSNDPKIAPYWDDLTTGSNGYIKYGVNGTAPNRTLVVEWKANLYTGTGSVSATAPLIFQAILSESTGKIQFIYGGTIGTNNSTTAVGYSTGFSGSSTDLVSVATTSNGATYGTDPNTTQITAIAAGKSYTFTPLIPVAPTNLGFSAISTTGMTLSWTEPSPATNIVQYAIYISTDNVTYTYFDDVLVGTNTYAATGLTANTLYYWKVYSTSEGALSSTSLSGSQITGSQATISTGTWIAPACVTSVDIEVWGAGGGGGSSANATTNGGSGGGGGAYSKSTLTVVPGNTYYINVGTAGAGGPASSSTVPGAGGDSWFNLTNVAPTSTAGVLAKGGGAGSNNSVATGGTGGAVAAGFGTIKNAGGTGAAGSGSAGGGGGASAGTAAVGGNGTAGGNGNSCGAGGTAPTGGGAGGSGGGSCQANGITGTVPGGGGGGSDDVAAASGGAGAAGKVVLTYITSSQASAPVVISPICPGSTSVSGTSLEATGTTITVYKNGTSQGTTTVSAGTWTKTGLTLAANDVITATAVNSPCKTVSVSSAPVTVNLPATPGTITGTATQCPALAGQTYTITAVTGATTYTWTVPTGWSITAGAGTTSITVTTGATGQNGNVTVTAGNTCGNSAASSFAVTVIAATPATPATITGTVTQCNGLTGQVYSISSVTNATTYTWVVPTGWAITSGQGTTSIVVTTGASGQNGNITVTAGNTCGTSAASSLAVTVITIPAAPGTIAGTTAQCSASTGQVYSISAVTNATSYTWTVPSGWSITAGQGSTSITATIGSSGGNILVSATNSCGTSTGVSQVLNINPLNVVNGTGYTNSTTKNSGDMQVADGATTGYLKFNLSGLTGATAITATTLSLTNNGSATSTATNAVVPLVNNDPTIATAAALYSATDGPPANTYNQSVWSATGTINLNLNASGGNTNASTDILSRISSPGYLALGLYRGGTNNYIFYGYAGATPPVLAVTYTSPRSLAVTVNTAPSISVQPTTPATTCSGSGTQTISVTAAGTGLTYSWRRAGTAVTNGGVISGQGTSTLTLTNATTANAGSYDVVVSGTCTPAVTSSAVTVTVNTAPSISVQPTAPTATCSGSGTQNISVTAAGTGLTYSWRKAGTAVTNGGVISGQGTATLTLTSPTTTDAGSYDVVISGTCTPAVTSSAVTVTINPVTLITTGPTPASQTVLINNAATNLTLGAAGTSITYQWYSNTSNSNSGGTSLGAANGAQTNTYTPQTTVAGTLYYYAIVSGTCGTATSSVASVIVTNTNTWTGTTSNNWSTGSNWSAGVVPTSTNDASIPVVTTYPVLSVSSAINNLTIASGATVGIASNIFTINGSISGTGTITGSITSGLILSGTTGTIRFTQTGTGNYLNKLTLNTGATATLGNALNIAAFDGSTEGVLTASGTAVLTTGGFLTIKSTTNGTARIGIGSTTGGYISGNVTVERFIPQNSSKSWRLLASNTNGSQSINAAWQEGAVGPLSNPNPGFGTMIPGPGASVAAVQAQGYDSLSYGGSIFKYNPSTDNLDYVSNMLTTTFSSEPGYFIFIRGDRGPNQFNTGVGSTPTPPISSTVLRSTGALFTGDQAAVNTGASKYALLRNPYPSRLDMRNIVRAGSLIDAYQVWDPKLAGAFGVGAYQTFTKNIGTGNYEVSPGGGNYGTNGSVYNFIESGAAFFIQATTSGSAQVLEASKATGSALVNRPADATNRLLFSIYANNPGSTDLVDGGYVDFDASFSNDVDINDVRKSSNFGENFGLINAATSLVVERRALLTVNDTIHFDMNSLRRISYKLQITPSAISALNLNAILEDKYLGTATSVSLLSSTDYIFSVDATAGSYAADRFRIIFKPQTPLPVTITNIRAYAQAANVAVEWKVENQLNINHYEIEKSTNGTDFSKVGTQLATGVGRSSVTYNWLDINNISGTNYYRIKIVDASGESRYSAVAIVTFGNVKPSVKVIPNPVEAGNLNIVLTQQPKGTYQVRLINNIGQMVYNNLFIHAGSNATQSFILPSQIVRGSYQLELIAPDYSRIVQKVIIN